jgi:hypothetical protein
VSETELTATHHALLLADLARAAAEQAGTKDGEAAIRKAVRRYGEERGGRMAQAAQADGQPLTMAAFMAYGEWALPPGEQGSDKWQEGQDVHSRVHQCPWHQAWESSGLLPYGRLYCLEIDAALARGFNPDLTLEVNRTLANDGEPCEFVYREAGEPVSPAGRVKPWNYHAGHLYWTTRAVLIEELGEGGDAAATAALETFGERYGQAAAQVVLAYEGEDFTRMS